VLSRLWHDAHIAGVQRSKAIFREAVRCERSSQIFGGLVYCLIC
jgi:hypothetical protein